MPGRFTPANGSRLLDVTTDRLWLVLNGKRHYVSCVDVYKSLFRERVEIQEAESPEIESLKQGDDLVFGTCIVRAPNIATAYLLAVHPSSIRAYEIPNSQVLEQYGFDLSLCRQIQYLSKITKGQSLQVSSQEKSFKAYLPHRSRTPLWTGSRKASTPENRA